MNTVLNTDWGYAWTIAGVSILTVFVLLIILILVIKLQGKIVTDVVKKRRAASAAAVPAQAVVPSEESEPSDAEMAAIAMALQLHYNSHDDVPGMISLKPGLSSSSWCSRNLCMNKLK